MYVSTYDNDILLFVILYCIITIHTKSTPELQSPLTGLDCFLLVCVSTRFGLSFAPTLRSHCP